MNQQDDVKVEEILGQLRLRLQEKRALMKKSQRAQGSKGAFEAADYLLEVLKQHLSTDLSYSMTSHRPVLGKLIVFAKKFIRKLFTSTFNTSFWRQREFNVNLLSLINYIIEAHREYEKEHQQLFHEHAELIIRNKELKGLVEELIDALQRKGLLSIEKDERLSSLQRAIKSL